jgi:hypothetical protein
VKAPAVAVLALAGCLTGSPEDSRGEYPVDAVALLAPLSGDPPSVEGPIEFLATGMPATVVDPGARVVAAYHVRLPDDVTAFLALVNAASCTDREPLTGPDDPVAVQDIGKLQRVGDETHIFAAAFATDGQILDVDIETSTVYAPRNARFPRIVAALSTDDLRILACGELIWR